MKNLILFVLFALSVNLVSAAEMPAYRIFTKQGKPTHFDKMLKGVSSKQVILFGEYHDDAIIHWLQLKLTQELHSLKNGKIILAAEMFEADMQQPLNRYIKGETDEDTFKKEVTSLWKNYPTDYKPLVEFAKTNKLSFVASNIPRYMARMVYKNGFEALDTLSADKKLLLPPLPIPYDAELPGYKAMLTMMGGHGGENLPKSQATKDATMAFWIVQALKGENANHTLIHYNGTYHSDGYEGIGWYLKQYNSTLSVASISAVRQKDPSKLEKEHIGKADFIICVDEEMTRTH